MTWTTPPPSSPPTSPSSPRTRQLFVLTQEDSRTLFRIPFPDEGPPPTPYFSYFSEVCCYKDGTNPCANNDPVYAWKVFGDPSKLWYSSIPSTRPIYHTGGQNGLPSVDFNGTLHNLLGFGMYSDSEIMEYWLVVDPKNVTGMQMFIGYTPFFGLMMIATATPEYNVGYLDLDYYHNVAPPTTGPQLLRFRFDPTLGIATVWRNNILIGSGTFNHPGPPTAMALASRFDGSQYYAQCNFYAIRRYSALLTPSQADTVTEEFRAKYALW